MPKNTIIRPSPIHGKGLFALRSFRRGEAIEAIEGEIVLYESKSRFAIALTMRRWLILTNKVKYVNASSHPNVKFDSRHWRLVATRDIEIGDELTSEYQSVFL